MPPSFIKHGVLRLPLPEGWLDASQVVAVGPEDNGFRPNLVASLDPLPPGETLARFAQRTLEVLRKVQGFSLVEERPATFGPHQGILREYLFVVQGIRMAQYQFQLVKDSVGYSFTYSERPEKMASTKAVADRFFAALQVGDSPELAAPRLNTVLGRLW